MRPTARVRAAGATALVLVVLAEEVCFAGQPTVAEAGRIGAYYADHRASVVAGNVLWVAAAALLLVASRRCCGRAGRLAAGAAATVMTATSAVALGLAASAPDPPGGAVAWWRAEGRLFEVGAWLWLVVLVLLGLARGRAGTAWSAYLALVVAALAVVDPVGARWWLVVGGLAVVTASPGGLDGPADGPVDGPGDGPGGYSRVASRHAPAAPGA